MCDKMFIQSNRLKLWLKLTKDTPYRSKVKVIRRSIMYLTCFLMVIHSYAKIWYAYVKEQTHFVDLNS